MRYSVPIAVVLIAACISLALNPLNAGGTIEPFMELQSGPLTPGLVLDECPRPIHQVRLLVDAGLTSGTLVLDPNAPEFDEFGDLVGGILTPHVRGQGGPQSAMELACSIEYVKEGRERWHLYRISGPKIQTPLLISTKGSLGDSGPARLVVLSGDKKVKTVVQWTRYGLVVP